MPGPVWQRLYVELAAARGWAGSSPKRFWQRGGGWVAEVPVSCGFWGWGLILWRFFAGFSVAHRQKGGIPRGFVLPRPPRRGNPGQIGEGGCRGRGGRSVGVGSF